MLNLEPFKERGVEMIIQKSVVQCRVFKTNLLNHSRSLLRFSKLNIFTFLTMALSSNYHTNQQLAR